MNEMIVQSEISSRIVALRGKQVILDRDLAELYQVETKVLNQAVKRNSKRFPSDFIFQLNTIEKSELVTNCDRFKNLKHSTVNPYAFTEQGVYMLPSTGSGTGFILVIQAAVRRRCDFGIYIYIKMF